MFFSFNNRKEDVARIRKDMDNTMLPLPSVSKDFRKIYPLDDSIEQQVDMRRAQGRAAYVTTSCRIVNPYEVVGSKLLYGNMKLISRASFKINEILHLTNLWSIMKIVSKKSRISVACLAEAPGGFIDMIRRHFQDAPWLKTLATSISPNKTHNIPGFDRRLVETSSGGAGKLDSTLHSIHYSDLFDLNSTTDLTKEKFFLVTADGGDGSFDPMDRSLLGVIQVYHALMIVQKGGAVVIKLLDTSHDIFRTICYAMEKVFQSRVTILKPKSSRACNSEVYIIGLNAIDTRSMCAKLKPWILKIIEYNNDNGLLELPLYHSSSSMKIFCMYIHIRFENERQKYVKLALRVCKIIIQINAVLVPEELRNIEDGCLRCQNLWELGQKYLEEYPIQFLKN